MRRTSRAALAACLMAGAGTVAVAPAPVSAAPPPEVSLTSGPPGTKVEVSIAGCAADLDNSEFRYVEARLISGAAPNEVLAGAGASFEGPAVLVVPDWVDPDAPASIEASCVVVDESGQQSTETAGDPVAFDILPGTGAPTQTRTYSRTSLASGQGFRVDAAGCTLANASYRDVTVFSTEDPSGRTLGDVIAGGEQGDGDAEGTSFQAEVLLAQQSIGFGSSSGGVPGDQQLDISEDPMPVAPGRYTTFASCADDEGTTLLYEPQTIVVTGSSPSERTDLVIPAGTRDVQLDGDGCTAGQVRTDIESFSPDPYDTADLGAGDPGRQRAATGQRRSAPGSIDPFGMDRPSPMTRIGPRASEGRGSRAVELDDFTTRATDPDADGSWSIRDQADFDLGFVIASSNCGDPFEDGFAYDVQGAVVDVRSGPNALPGPGSPGSPPAPSPAVAVAGRPNFTG